MLAAEAMRLAAVEVLCPTAATRGEAAYPTLAGKRVYDSRAVPLEDLDGDAPFTPVIALYTTESGVSLRGPMAAADDTEADAVLDIVAELAVSSDDEGETIADAMIAEDPKARLVLAALCSQVRSLLERSQSGGLWRTVVKRIIKTEYQSFAVPQLGLRWQRITIRMHCEVRDDDYQMTDGGLPEPIRSLYAKLPADSYAKIQLATLFAHFAPELLPSLREVRVTTAGVTSGL